MLTITDKSGKPKFVLSDEDTQPIKIDELILKDKEPRKEKKKKNE